MQRILYHKLFNVEYIDEGEGAVVLLLHGFGEDNSIWKNQVSFLKNQYRVIAPNMFGVGHSSLLTKENISIADYAQALYEFVTSVIGNQKFSLLGHSMGGYIALEYVRQYSNSLLSFGLIHSTAFADSDEKKNIRTRAIDTMQAYGAESFLKNTIPNLFSEKSKAIALKEMSVLVDNSIHFNVLALQQFYAAMRDRSDATQVLQNTHLPVLFIIGEEDKAAPMQDVLQQSHLPLVASVYVLKDVAHMGMIENPEAVNNALLHFLLLN